jgi:hypothetical protein
MRNLLMAGTASLFLAIGATGAYADEIVTRVNGPVYAGGAPMYDAYGNELIYPAAPPLIEGRSAFIERDPAYVPAQPAYVYRPGERRVYTPFPFSVLPWNW